jgi:transcriptional regulator with XRE-family HTH domain
VKTPSTFGARLREQRKRRGWTVRRLAAEASKCGIALDPSGANVVKFEMGTRTGNVHTDTARAFGRALKVNPAYLMGLSDDPVPPRDPVLKKKA